LNVTWLNSEDFSSVLTVPFKVLDSPRSSWWLIVGRSEMVLKNHPPITIQAFGAFLVKQSKVINE
jgi:hypothetical protein